MDPWGLLATWVLGRLTGGSLGLAGHPLATWVLGRQISGSLGLAGHPLATRVLGREISGSLGLAGHLGFGVAGWWVPEACWPPSLAEQFSLHLLVPCLIRGLKQDSGPESQIDLSSS